MKTVLAMLIAVSAYLAGCGVASRQAKVCDSIKEIIELCEYMEHRMTYSSDKLDVIFKASGTGIGKSAAEKGFGAAVDELGLPEDCRTELHRFASTLGVSGYDSQMASVKGLRSFLIMRHTKLSEGLGDRQKCIKAVFGLVGALIGILLI